jgi:hypothetical protein
MRFVTMAALALLCCAAQAAEPLALHEDKAEPAAIDAAFAEEIAQRFGSRARLPRVRADLESQGFQCADTAPSSGSLKRGVTIMAYCQRPRPNGLCADLWGVELVYAGAVRSRDPVRVAPKGWFDRSCAAGASPTG